MKVEEKGHTINIKDTQGDIASFLEKITSNYNSFKDHNIVLDLTQYATITLQEGLSFLSLSNKHREAKKSFVIVINDFDFNDAPEEMMIVPTLLEAHDVIEMEEIERDLGF
ncbi:MAG: ribonuclease Z [Flavobacterium sp. MedPE-SWcel]|uniref:ribonuclease Z n=1 Tax=uncultured Flavobacterium sp. TaxID=165435 RepID=UPI00091BBEE1|nr:ribonuclease Z [uncultured Flavobacterium sp.]OIQ18639.1 MAG: ribonuclease Z [Flavobacterium sp. MedPE-SWcel]